MDAIHIGKWKRAVIKLETLPIILELKLRKRRLKMEDYKQSLRADAIAGRFAVNNFSKESYPNLFYRSDKSQEVSESYESSDFSNNYLKNVKIGTNQESMVDF